MTGRRIARLVRARRTARVALVAAAFAGTAAHADQPLWELGLGAAALRIPQYRGSDESRGWLLPLPYFVYRGAILRSDREGTRAVLVDAKRFDLDLSLSLSPPASSSGNDARKGMPDLKATFGLGPNVNATLARGAHWKLQLRLPLRGVWTVESSPRWLGWNFNPVLNLDLQAAGWNFGVHGGPQWAARRYDAYFYGVPSAYATASRPAYDAPGGGAGWGAGASASRRLGDWWLGAYLHADALGGASFESSPLVRSRHNLSVGLAASWIFKTSDGRVPDSR
ncbi:MAG: MipA/OmpV family protein [Burkholderiales bacterium]|nr:MipA/OmpV family protein [Burkholderiales bacterium]